MAKRISVVTTFLNEEALIEEFINRVQGVLDKLPEYESEIVFVDDNSTDRSYELIKARAAKDSRIKALRTSRRFGVYPCLRAGLAHATGDAVVYLETDLQDPPELIPTLVEKWAAGADVVYTTRSRRYGENPGKMFITKIAYRVISFLSEVAVPVDSGDYKLLARRVVDEINRLPEDDPYFRGVVSWVGFKQVQVFYERAPRHAGVSMRGLTSLIPLKVFVSAILASSNRPLIFSALAFIPSTFCLILAGLGFMTGHPLLAWTLLGLMVLIAQASIGVIALYLARVYNDARRRPPYLIAEKLGF